VPCKLLKDIDDGVSRFAVFKPANDLMFEPTTKFASRIQDTVASKIISVLERGCDGQGIDRDMARL
jgi:hypothetical protein